MRSWPTDPAFGSQERQHVIAVIKEGVLAAEPKGGRSVLGALRGRPPCWVLDPDGLLTGRKWRDDFVSYAQEQGQADLRVEDGGQLYYREEPLRRNVANSICLAVGSESPSTLVVYGPATRRGTLEAAVVTHVNNALGLGDCEAARRVGAFG